MASKRSRSQAFDAVFQDKAFINVRRGTDIYELEVNVKLVFDEVYEDVDVKDDDYDNDNFDKLCSPNTKRDISARTDKAAMPHDDREVALLLNNEYEARGTRAEKTLKLFQHFDRQGNVDPERPCTGDPAIIQDVRNGEQYYLCFAGYKALWGFKGGDVRDGNGIKVQSYCSTHRSFRNFNSTTKFRTGNPDHPILMLIKSPRPTKKVGDDKLVPTLISELFTPPVTHSNQISKGQYGSRSAGPGSYSRTSKKRCVDTESKTPTIDLTGDEDDRLIAAKAEISERISELIAGYIEDHEEAIKRFIGEEIRHQIKEQVRAGVKKKFVASGLMS